MWERKKYKGESGVGLRENSRCRRPVKRECVSSRLRFSGEEQKSQTKTMEVRMMTRPIKKRKKRKGSKVRSKDLVLQRRLSLLGPLTYEIK